MKGQKHSFLFKTFLNKDVFFKETITYTVHPNIRKYLCIFNRWSFSLIRIEFLILMVCNAFPFSYLINLVLLHFGTSLNNFSIIKKHFQKQILSLSLPLYATYIFYTNIAVKLCGGNDFPQNRVTSFTLSNSNHENRNIL